jgi:hypothetical protein
VYTDKFIVGSFSTLNPACKTPQDSPRGVIPLALTRIVYRTFASSGEIGRNRWVTKAESQEIGPHNTGYQWVVFIVQARPGQLFQA